MARRLESIGVLILATLISLAPARAQATVSFPPQPEGVPWPTDTWEAGEFDADVEALALRSLIETAFAAEKTELMGETRALLIVHRGQLVFERYREGYGPNSRHVSWSVAKSVTQALVGRAIATGLAIDADAPMPGPWAEDDPRAAITWRQWLTMTDGLDYLEMGAPSPFESDVTEMMFGQGRGDVIAFAKKLTQSAEPGRRFNYSTAGYHLIANALQRVIGAGDCTLADNRANTASTLPLTPCVTREMRFTTWADQVLFDVIGMDPVLEYDASGTFLGGSLVWASARDFARFGYLYLRGGMWEGEQILPEGWVDFARTRGPDARINTYGAGFWLTPPAGQPARLEGYGVELPPHDAFSAQGHEGQIIWIVPSKDLVIVRLGLMPNTRENWLTLMAWCQSIAIAFPDVGTASPR